ncbi:LytR/AlgR family response regulator transcription factor [Methylobacter luteus]|uniref:LytR/AlgR family response regulator transcription factor n=1 Tax=Methylobacter luteus TaxID=415 RepID=UPI0004176E31|nr:response regulator transcription factor [Methylobacter luteus]
MVDKRSVIIVDDECWAREDLKSILKRRHPDFEVIAEAANSQDAWRLINEYPEIDGVFLDIHIQAENERAGLDLAYAINRMARSPWIVFITGYQQTAVEAHRLHPAHYLLKPLDDDKVDEALDWIRKQQPATLPEKVIQPKRIVVRHRITNHFDEHEWHTEFIDPGEIVFITKNKAANTLKIHLSNNKVLDGVNGTIKEWEHKYTVLGFLQIHRSHLVNLKQVRSLKPRAGENEVYKVALKDSLSELAVGSEYLDVLREKMKTGQF